VSSRAGSFIGGAKAQLERAFQPHYVRTHTDTHIDSAAASSAAAALRCRLCLRRHFHQLETARPIAYHVRHPRNERLEQILHIRPLLRACFEENQVVLLRELLCALQVRSAFTSSSSVKEAEKQ
jgi:hypothetical protein